MSRHLLLWSGSLEILKTKIKRSKEDIAMETARLEGLKISNQKVEETIQSLHHKSSAWQTQNKDDIEKLQKNLQELENVDVEKELDAHKILEDNISLLHLMAEELLEHETIDGNDIKVMMNGKKI